MVEAFLAFKMLSLSIKWFFRQIRLRNIQQDNQQFGNIIILYKIISKIQLNSLKGFLSDIKANSKK